jgi:hypothetical protein
MRPPGKSLHAMKDKPIFPKRYFWYGRPSVPAAPARKEMNIADLGMQGRIF